MDRRSFLKNTGWSFLGLAASGSLLGSCVAGSKEAKEDYAVGKQPESILGRLAQPL